MRKLASQKYDVLDYLLNKDVEYVCEVVNSLGVDIEKGSIRLPEGALKELGNHKVDIELHPEVIHEIQVSIEAEE